VPASRAAPIVTVNPVFTTLIAAWPFRDRLNTAIVAGMTPAALAASIVLTTGEPWWLFAGALGLGEWLLLGGVLAMAGMVLMNHARR
jgi:drug/metabolite transporter (DMT)-like permease